MFNVTFEIVTEESAEYGEAAESGFIAQDVTLRDAIKLVQDSDTQNCGVENIEANEYPVISPRWITVQHGMDLHTGDYESRSLHFPKSMTGASRRRVCRLLGVYGSK